MRSLGLLSGGEGDLGGNTVEVLGSFLGDDPGVDLKLVTLLVLLEHFQLLKLLQSPSDHLSGCVNVVRESVSGVLS